MDSPPRASCVRVSAGVRRTLDLCKCRFAHAEKVSQNDERRRVRARSRPNHQATTQPNRREKRMKSELLPFFSLRPHSHTELVRSGNLHATKLTKETNNGHEKYEARKKQKSEKKSFGCTEHRSTSFFSLVLVVACCVRRDMDFMRSQQQQRTSDNHHRILVFSFSRIYSLFFLFFVVLCVSALLSTRFV